MQTMHFEFPLRELPAVMRGPRVERRDHRSVGADDR